MRERVFLFVSLIAGALALADVLWLSPAQVAHKQLTQRFDKQSAELQRARDELKTVARPVDAGKVVREGAPSGGKLGSRHPRPVSLPYLFP